MEQEVRRDAHKMHAFVRFRRIEDADGERYVAWYRPDHHIVAMTADFFVDRFRIAALVDPDAGSIGALGRRRADLRPRPAARGGAGRRRDGDAVARLLRRGLQPGPAEPEGDARRDAGAPLGDAARGAAAAVAGRRRADPRPRHARRSRRGADGAAVRAGLGRSRRAAARRRDVHRLRAACARDADGVRRGPGARAAAAGRRAARRSGGSCRARRSSARPATC